jgi:hypothetical protein
MDPGIISAKVISNRFNPSEIKLSELRKSLVFFKNLQRWYINKHNIQNKKIIRDIISLRIEQTCDIWIQVLKRGAFYQKLIAACVLPLLYFGFFNLIGTSKYFRAKFSGKFSRAIKAQHKQNARLGDSPKVFFFIWFIFLACFCISNQLVINISRF